MEISEIIYEVSVEPSYKINRVDSKRAGNIREIRVVAASSKSYSEVVNHSGNLNQRYVDHLIDRLSNAVIHHAVSYILKQDENTKLSAKSEPQEYDTIDSEIDKKDMYLLYKFSLGDSHKQ